MTLGIVFPSKSKIFAPGLCDLMGRTNAEVYKDFHSR